MSQTISGMDRPSWNDWALGIARAASTRGDCRRSKVGAVLMNTWTHETFLGYNGTDSGVLGCLEGACPRGRLSYDELATGGDYGDCIARHAEENAIRWAEDRGVNWFNDSVSVWKMFITKEPCGLCQQMMSFRGIEWTYDTDS